MFVSEPCGLGGRILCLLSVWVVQQRLVPEPAPVALVSPRPNRTPVAPPAERPLPESRRTSPPTPPCQASISKSGQA